MRRPRRLTPAVLVLTMSSWWSACHAPAVAATTADDDPRARGAREACLAGRVDPGIRLLREYLDATKDVTAVFNMARCYQFNHRPAEALERFREYLRRAKDLGPQEREQVRVYMAELEAEQRASGHGARAGLEREAAPGPMGPRAAASSGPVPAPAQGTASAAASPTSVSPPTASPQPAGTALASPAAASPALASPVRDEAAPRSTMRRAGLIVGAAGLASLGAGLVFGLRLQSANDQLDAQLRNPSPSAADYTRTWNESRMDETLQWTFLGVGAAALTGGAVLYLMGRSAHEPTRTALVPWSRPDGRGVSLQGVF